MAMGRLAGLGQLKNPMTSSIPDEVTEFCNVMKQDSLYTGI
jgi:hypothetical protein